MMITLAEQNFLRRLFLQQFDKDEIKGFYFALMLEIDHLEASSREKLIADLLHHSERQSRLSELLTQAIALRPNLTPTLTPFLQRLPENLPVSSKSAVPSRLDETIDEFDESSESLVFISYSYRDEAWHQRILSQLTRCLSPNRIRSWDDQYGDDYAYHTMQQTMQRSEVAVLLISSHFLSSDFVLKEHVPSLLTLQNRGQLRLYPIIIKPCTWQLVDWLHSIDVHPAHQHALSMNSDSQIDAFLVQISSEIVKHLQ
jgi:hypothetical protein